MNLCFFDLRFLFICYLSIIEHSYKNEHKCIIKIYFKDLFFRSLYNTGNFTKGILDSFSVLNYQSAHFDNWCTLRELSLVLVFWNHNCS